MAKTREKGHADATALAEQGLEDIKALAKHTGVRSPGIDKELSGIIQLTLDRYKLRVPCGRLQCK